MKKNSVKGNWIYTIKALFKSDKIAIFQLFTNSILSGITPLIWVLTPKLIIDELLGDKNLYMISLILMVAFLLASVSNYFKAYFEESFRMRVSKLRLELGVLVHDCGMNMDFKHTETEKDVVLMQQAISATTSPTRGFGMVLKVTYTMGALMVSFIGFSTIITTLHPLILLLILINVLVVHYMMERAMKYSRDHRHEMKKHENKSRYIASVMSDFSYGKDIRLFQLKSLLNGKKKAYDYERHLFNKNTERRYLQRDIVDVLFGVIRNVVAYGYVTYLVLNNVIGVGSFLMYVVSVSELTQVVKELFYQQALLKDASVRIDDYMEFLENNAPKEKVTSSPLPEEGQLGIDFKNVSFTYPGAEKVIFDGINLSIKPGEKLAVVGVNGAGKTTLVKLMTKLYEPTGGTITIGGVDYKEINRDDIYGLYSAVFQEIRPLALSVRENIIINDDVDDDIVWDCIEKAGLRDKISSLENGLDTAMLKVLDLEGVELSGGENQKLALARALYKKGRVVVLDEPTAALDPLAEKEIYEGFNKMIGGRTAIFISHRLSSTKFCDRIAMFEDGKIIECGSHDELMKLNGKYRAMFEIQSQYYQDDSLQEVV